MTAGCPFVEKHCGRLCPSRAREKIERTSLGLRSVAPCIRSVPPPSSASPCESRCGSPDCARRRARNSPGPKRPGSLPPRPPRKSASSQSVVARHVHPVTTDGPRSDQKAIGGCESTRPQIFDMGMKCSAPYPCWRHGQPAWLIVFSTRLRFKKISSKSRTLFLIELNLSNQHHKSLILLQKHTEA